MFGQRLGGRAAGVDGEGLAVQGRPVGVGGLVDDGEEPGRTQLAEDPQRGARPLDQGVRRAEADVGLAADDGLVGEVLVGQLDQLDVDALVAHPLEGDEEGQRLHRLDVAEGDPDLVCVIAACSASSPQAASRSVRAATAARNLGFIVVIPSGGGSGRPPTRHTRTARATVWCRSHSIRSDII